MAAISRPPIVVGPDGLRQQMQAGDVLALPVYAVANLPTGTGIQQGSLAYASNGRGLVGGLVNSLTMQAAGAGTGCLVTYSGSAWQVAGTSMSVQA